MSVQILVERARARARQVMVDTCVVERPVAGEFDPATGLPGITYTPVYSGACRVRSVTAANVTSVERLIPEAAEQVTHRPVLLLPYGDAGAADARAGDRVTCAGQTYTVVATMSATTQTSRAYVIEQVEVS